MGTNYYVKEEEEAPCECCGRPYESQELHIGKSSHGWKFVFRRHNGLDTFDRWVSYLLRVERDGGSIVDEYGDRISASDMILKIISKQDEPFGVPGGDGEYESDSGYLCPAGYRFSKREFS